MLFTEMLAHSYQTNQSMLCVGLDPDPQKFPLVMQSKKDAIFEFCAKIVDATHDLAIAFKPQIAYFAAHRAEEQLERLIKHIKDVAPHVPVILDAKRGDIGATSEQYAVEAFERYQADAVTLSPFMGFDSVEPYLKYKDKGVFLLCRTSNKSGDDLQNKRIADLPGEPFVYEHVAHLAQNVWNINGQLGLVVGATYPQEIAKVREIAPSLALLIPGVGAQGGDAHATVQAGFNTNSQLVINSSRAILYASSQNDFEQKARAVAQQTRDLLNSAKPQPRV
jgi:orotidine-5'-phosphate decarboxylase